MNRHNLITLFWTVVVLAVLFVIGYIGEDKVQDSRKTTTTVAHVR